MFCNVNLIAKTGQKLNSLLATYLGFKNHLSLPMNCL
jgi:hypothetical protein